MNFDQPHHSLRHRMVKYFEAWEVKRNFDISISPCWICWRMWNLVECLDPFWQWNVRKHLCLAHWTCSIRSLICSFSQIIQCVCVCYVACFAVCFGLSLSWLSLCQEQGFGTPWCRLGIWMALPSVLFSPRVPTSSPRSSDLGFKLEMDVELTHWNYGEYAECGHVIRWHMHRCIDLYFDHFLCFDSTGGIFFVIVTTFIAVGVRNILSVVQDFYPEMIHQVGSTEAVKHVSVVLEAFDGELKSKSHTEVAVLNSTSSFSGKLICTWLGCFFCCRWQAYWRDLANVEWLEIQGFSTLSRLF